MYKWPLLALLAVVVLLAAGHDQDLDDCGHAGLLDTPWYQENLAEFEAMRTEMHETSHLHRRDTETLRVAVVWHILTDSPSNNVTREAIVNEMSWLNAWFSGSNRQYDPNDMFSAIVARPDDLNIQFYLAERDPEGRPFDGIRWVNGATTARTCSSGSTANFYTDRGGDDLWDSTQYMNIYTCDITNAAGFAFLPSSRPFDFDGAVMDYTLIGNPNGFAATTAHEVGHWLGLPHTFSGYSCDRDDGLQINDTPNTDSPSSSWVPADDRCNSDSSRTEFNRCGSPVMVRNIMDYNYFPCKSYFSKGQAYEMRNHLTSPSSPRSSLPFSPALPSTCSTYDCSGKSCGPDGCGGQCGLCPSYTECTSDQTCQSTLPLNTQCSTAEVLDQSTSGYTVTKNTGGLTNYAPSCDFQNFLSHQGALWYKFTARASGTAQLSTAGSSMDTIMTRVNVPSCSGQLYCGSFSDDVSSFDESASLEFSVSAGNTYWIVVSGKENARGDLRLTLVMTGGGFGCTPSCGTRSCGSDGCGGSCGSCTGRTFCNSDFECEALPSVSPSPSAPASATASVTPAPSTTRTPAPSTSPSRTPVPTPSPSPEPVSGSPSAPPSPSSSETPDPSPTSSASKSPAPSITSTPAPSLSIRASQSPTPSPSMTPQATQSSAPCDPQAECAANDFQCGTSQLCGVRYDCGQCIRGHVCSENKCTCPIGSTFVEGECVLDPVGIPDWSEDFQQIAPQSPVGFVVEGDELRVTRDDEMTLRWLRSAEAVEKYTTLEELTVTATSGLVGFGARHGQLPESQRGNDRMEWRLSNLDGEEADFQLCLVYYGRDYCYTLGRRSFPSAEGVDVRLAMGFDDSNDAILLTLVVNGRRYFGSCFARYYQELGAMSYYFSADGAPRAVMTDIKLATSSTLIVTLTDCKNQLEWEELFYSLSTADPATTQLDIDTNGSIAGCESQGAKALASGFTIVVSSLGAPAKAITDAFLAAAAGPAGFAAGINSASVIGGSAGAAAAGLPAATVGAGASSIVIPAGALGAAGGGGGAAGGLSGGAIAGIVLGSVGGALLLVSLAVIVVVAVVVAAAVIAKRRSDDRDAPADSFTKPTRDPVTPVSSESTPEMFEVPLPMETPVYEQPAIPEVVPSPIYDVPASPERSLPASPEEMRKKIIANVFGGVDVMAHDPEKHSSITNRSPASTPTLPRKAGHE